MPTSVRPRALLGAAVTLVMVGAGLVAAGPAAAGEPRVSRATRSTTTTSTTTTSTTAPALPGTTGTVTTTTADSPARTIVKDDRGVVAVFTAGSRTVTLRGPERVFAESTTSAVVRSTTWVRLLPQPSAGTADWEWLGTALASTAPDVLALAMQYTTSAPAVHDQQGLQIAGDASYGPLTATGREEGSDFNDYLGVAWSYGSTTDAPETRQFRSLDCSGYVRMAFGYRGGVPLVLRPDGAGLPRRAVEMLASAPGVVVQPDLGTRPPVPTALAPGDLLFFDASTDDGTAVDHVGIYLGVDSAGAPRFLSSRKTVDGPTLGDTGGKSVLKGTGLYATSFRAVRRL
ncbi:cell wall-associated NlpC family hydrolase [Kineococcus xinjiangensis]|uniref:Cell wall-associated NlpC family hydrolase n=1 Tax=Kineococcus xinjiangensis TaxID=512762 RepID=A0A2S6IME2_9ACTN|nr:NlpC/P60 family protein [Kineococcus xinjiangensis]PPK95379.1 cell wall-associated NlpC family hydrolase [Kineococcus xinjiangensis]